MHNLLLIHESLTNKYSIETLDILSIFIIISGIYIVIIRNPIVSILFLIGLFGGVSSYLIFIGLSFIGLAYLIIYVGAVSILFLFILMLINIRISELQNYNYNSLLLALVILIFLNSSLIQILPYSSAVLNNYLLNINNTLYSISLHKDSINYVYKNVGTNHNNNGLLFASSNDWNSNIININDISNIGNILYTSYNIWLIITSFILLLAMVGTIIITIKK